MTFNIAYYCVFLSNIIYMHNASKTNLPFIYIFKISDEKKLQENTSKSLQVLEVCIHNNSLSKQNKFVLFYITA